MVRGYAMMKHQKGANAPTEEREIHMALSAKEAAIELGTDARTFRKFMRNILPKEDQPGQGNRYAIEEKDLKKLRKQFADWSKPKATPTEEKAKTNGKGKKAKPADEVVDITDEVDVDVLSDEDLEDLMQSDPEDLLDEDIFDLD